MRPHGTPAGERLDRKLCIGAHSRNPSSTTLRTQQGQPRVDRGAAVGQAALVDRTFGRISAAIGLNRLAPDHGEQPAEHGDRCVPLECPVLLEPVDPALDGRGPAALICRESAALDQRRHSVDVRGGLCVRDGVLQVPVRRAPFGCTTKELRHELGFGSPQLRLEQLLEQVVVAVGLACGVQRHQEHVGAGQRLQNRGGAAPLEDSVTERSRQALENSCSCQEAKVVRRQVPEQFRAQVVGHKTVAPGKFSRAVAVASAAVDRQCGEVEARSPALRPLGQQGDLSIRGDLTRPHVGAGEPLFRPCEARPGRSPP